MRLFFHGAMIALCVAGCVQSGGHQPLQGGQASPNAARDAATVQRGAQLAAIGDCNTCHTAEGGKTFAGGRAFETAFGTVYASNITPDAATGIGTWSLDAFMRAMREGVSRDGRDLYPVFPYDHFTHATDADLEAVYAFVMAQQPVANRPPENQMRFPFGFRITARMWKALFLDDRPFQPDRSHPPEWNRGAYLVQTLGHCGACHTPRNWLGAEKGAALSGGDAEGWKAPALNGDSPAPVPWTVGDLYTYLRGGADNAHDVAAGPMGPVAHNLAHVGDADVHAIATYIGSMTAKPQLAQNAQANGKAAPQADRMPSGEAVYAGACGDCHGNGARAEHSALDLSLSTSLALATPENFLRTVIDGIVPEDGTRGAWMPPFASSLSNAQLADLANYLRARAGKPQWADIKDKVSKLRRENARDIASR